MRISRILYGAVTMAAAFAVVLSDAWVAHWCDGPSALGTLLRFGSIIPLCMATLCVIGSCELTSMMRSSGLRPFRVWAVTVSAMLVLAPWLAAAHAWRHELSHLEVERWLLIFLAVAVMGTAAAQLSRGAVDRAMEDVSATCMTHVYLGVLPSFLVLLRSSEGAVGPTGAWLILILVVVTKSSDIGAYLVGATIGRRRLAPMISPNKSVEGFCGGVAISIVLSLAFRTFATIPMAFAGAGAAADASGMGGMHSPFADLSAVQAVFFGALLGLVGQAGDPFESILKRSANTKDSGAVVPQLGGMLDILDSLVVAAPVAWFLLDVWWNVV